MSKPLKIDFEQNQFRSWVVNMTLTIGRLLTVVYNRVIRTCLRKITRFFIYHAIVQYLKPYVCYVMYAHNIIVASTLNGFIIIYLHHFWFIILQ